MRSCMNGAPPVASARGFTQPDGRCWELGHVLRYDDDTPAFLALKFCVFTEGSGSGFKGRRGAPRLNLLNVFRNDLKRRKIVNTLSNLDDLEILRATAINKVFWKSLSNIKYDIIK